MLDPERLEFSVFRSRGARGAKPWRFLNGQHRHESTGLPDASFACTL